jgi:hypothetical protein
MDGWMDGWMDEWAEIYKKCLAILNSPYIFTSKIVSNKLITFLFG